MLRWGSGAAGACAMLAAVEAPAQAQENPETVTASPAGADEQDGGAPEAMPLGNPGEWLTDEDYPAEAFQDDVSGVTGFRLAIDELGMPTLCSVTATSGSALLDATTCAKLMERARFHPVVDDSGQAVPGFYENMVRWRSSDPVPDPNATTPQSLDMELWVGTGNLLYDPAVKGDMTVSYDLDVDEAGSVKGCKITRSSGDGLFDRSVCRQLEVNAAFEVSSSGPGRYSGSHTEYEQVLRVLSQTDRTRSGARNYAVQAYIEEDGSVSGCKWMGRNAPDLDPWPICTRSSWAEQRNTSGKLVRGRVTLHVAEDRLAELANPDELNNSRNRGLTIGFDEDRTVSRCRWSGPNPPSFDPMRACNFVVESMRRHDRLADLVQPGSTFELTLDKHEVAVLEAQQNSARASD
jgi:hypothetical protein